MASLRAFARSRLINEPKNAAPGTRYTTPESCPCVGGYDTEMANGYNAARRVIWTMDAVVDQSFV